MFTGIVIIFLLYTYKWFDKSVTLKKIFFLISLTVVMVLSIRIWYIKIKWESNVCKYKIIFWYFPTLHFFFISILNFLFSYLIWCFSFTTILLLSIFFYHYFYKLHPVWALLYYIKYIIDNFVNYSCKKVLSCISMI